MAVIQTMTPLQMLPLTHSHEEIYQKDKRRKIQLYLKGFGEYPDSPYQQSHNLYELNRPIARAEAAKVSDSNKGRQLFGRGRTNI